MIFGIFIAMAIGLYFDLPLLLVLVIAAILQGGTAYALTRNPVALQTTVPVLIFAILTLLIAPMLRDMDNSTSVALLIQWLTYATYAISSIGLVATTLLGLMGGNGAKPTTSNIV